MLKQILQVSVRTDEEIKEADTLLTEMVEVFKEGVEVGELSGEEDALELLVIALSKEVLLIQTELRRLVTAGAVIENEAFK